MQRILQHKKRLLWLFCYGLFLLFFLLRGLVFLVYDNTRPEAPLTPSMARQVDLAEEAPGEYRTLSGDGQLIFNNIRWKGRRLVVDGAFENYPGELDLYYQKEGQSGFSPKQRVWARPLAEGGYEYLLAPGTYTGIRLDTGTEGNNLFSVRGIVLNQPLPPGRYFLPTPREALGLLVLPALASCVIYTIMEWYQWWKTGRRGAKKKEDLDGHE